MTTHPSILVTGATGHQGLAAIHYLSEAGFEVMALTRNPGSSIARTVTRPNVQFVEGDLNLAESYRDHLKKSDSVLCILSFKHGAAREIEQGKKLVDAAKESGIRHFLYSSILGAGRNSQIPHFDSKWQIENHLRQAGLPFTILRPASLFENFLIPQLKKGILKGKLMQPALPETRIPYVSAQDVGRASVQVFSNPQDYLGQTRILATEHLDGYGVANAFSSVLNRNIKCQKMPALAARIFLNKYVYKMFAWLNEENRYPDLDLKPIREEFPFLLSLPDWINKYFLPTNNP